MKHTRGACKADRQEIIKKAELLSKGCEDYSQSCRVVFQVVEVDLLSLPSGGSRKTIKHHYC